MCLIFLHQNNFNKRNWNSHSHIRDMFVQVGRSLLFSSQFLQFHVLEMVKYKQLAKYHELVLQHFCETIRKKIIEKSYSVKMSEKCSSLVI